jgi:hypothetical protein
MFIAAMIIYADQGPVEGLKALTVMTESKYLEASQKQGNYKGFLLSNKEIQRWNERLGGKPYIAHSYIGGMRITGILFDHNLGTHPENGYVLPVNGPYDVFVDGTNPNQPTLTGFVLKKVFVACSGAASARPLQMSQNDKGFFYIQYLSTEHSYFVRTLESS